MEPMHDDDLNRLLAQWRAPETPPGLRARALAKRPHRSRIPSHVRVPTPVAALALAAMLLLGYFAFFGPRTAPPSAPGDRFASFKPAEDLNLRVVRLPHEEE